MCVHMYTLTCARDSGDGTQILTHARLAFHVPALYEVSQIVKLTESKSTLGSIRVWSKLPGVEGEGMMGCLSLSENTGFE